jgi:pyrimidine-specific ribonucleoside hydrolase
MLDGLWHEGLPAAYGPETTTLIEKCLADETAQVSFIALGSLVTAAEAMDRSPLFLKKVKQILWSNEDLPGEGGMNYRLSPEAVRRVLDGPLPVFVTGGGGESFYNADFISGIDEIFTPYAKTVASILRSNASHKFVFTAFDEMAPLFLHYPELFGTDKPDDKNRYYYPLKLASLQTATSLMLRGETVQKMQVVKRFPADTSFYMTDIQPFISDIIKNHGEEEWVSGILANEMHRHLGVYAIIGVKMGIRAREYFCTGVDEMRVTSRCGSTPPLSCTNDGIQLSTGATPGHGLLTVSGEEPYFAGADFTHKNRTIRITLKKEFENKVSAELKEISFIYGLDSDIYWELVRQNAIRYWVSFDRHDIFDIEPIN